MAVKSILILCASACFVKIISAQCIGAVNNIAGAGLAADELGFAGNGYANNAISYGAGGIGLGAPFGYAAAPGLANYGLANSIAPSNGGGFAVTSFSPISPTGITVFSENGIEGALAVNGQLPFLGAIALEGALPSAGAGAINYGCGNGAVGIVSEGIAPGPVGPAAYPAGPGFNPALAGGLGYQGLAGGFGFNGRNGLGLGGCGAIY